MSTTAPSITSTSTAWSAAPGRSSPTTARPPVAGWAASTGSAGSSRARWTGCACGAKPARRNRSPTTSRAGIRAPRPWCWSCPSTRRTSYGPTTARGGVTTRPSEMVSPSGRPSASPRTFPRTSPRTDALCDARDRRAADTPKTARDSRGEPSCGRRADAAHHDVVDEHLGGLLLAALPRVAHGEGDVRAVPEVPPHRRVHRAPIEPHGEPALRLRRGLVEHLEVEPAPLRQDGRRDGDGQPQVLAAVIEDVQGERAVGQRTHAKTDHRAPLPLGAVGERALAAGASVRVQCDPRVASLAGSVAGSRGRDQGLEALERPPGARGRRLGHQVSGAVERPRASLEAPPQAGSGVDAISGVHEARGEAARSGVLLPHVGDAVDDPSATIPLPLPQIAVLVARLPEDVRAELDRVGARRAHERRAHERRARRRAREPADTIRTSPSPSRRHTRRHSTSPLHHGFTAPGPRPRSCRATRAAAPRRHRGATPRAQ